jgi:hypothetical protein
VAVALIARFDLLADLRAAGRARRLVSEVLAAWNRAEDVEVARLLVSEIVTNAVRVQVSESATIPEATRSPENASPPEGTRTPTDAGGPKGTSPVDGDAPVDRRPEIPRPSAAGRPSRPPVTGDRFDGAPAVRLALVAHPDRVRFLVGDDSPLTPVLRSVRTWEESGRGIQLVAALASDWGVLDTPPEAGHGKQVWFELAADGTPTEVSGRSVTQET